VSCSPAEAVPQPRSRPRSCRKRGRFARAAGAAQALPTGAHAPPGFALVLLGWAMLGMGAQSYGFVLLFADFLPTALPFARKVPVLGYVLSLPPVRTVRPGAVARSASRSGDPAAGFDKDLSPGERKRRRPPACVRLTHGFRVGYPARLSLRTPPRCAHVAAPLMAPRRCCVEEADGSRRCRRLMPMQ